MNEEVLIHGCDIDNIEHIGEKKYRKEWDLGVEFRAPIKSCLLTLLMDKEMKALHDDIMEIYTSNKKILDKKLFLKSGKAFVYLDGVLLHNTSIKIEKEDLISEMYSALTRGYSHIGGILYEVDDGYDIMDSTMHVVKRKWYTRLCNLLLKIKSDYCNGYQPSAWEEHDSRCEGFS